ncbi:Prostacyclin receptor [Collichthys lucidus]|uniref:Thromboxane A2 receptor n=1 Tax=Collichthys lucidus TaxID=240159 RepID=A0A4U5V013_COLLU|nr:Prostacyclin receptor [Collichthys lucidus]
MNKSILPNESCNITCNNSLSVNGHGKPAVSIIMFLAGVVGNLLALFILGVHQKEHRSRASVFCILVTGLALTDLLGTCLLSPSVFISYAHNMSLISLGGERLCNVFGFAMSFFGLAPTLILCAMAVERCLAISHPYFYSVHIRCSFAKYTLFFIYLFSLGFCLLPYTGYGKFRQYCPGTWCFIDMDATGDEHANLVQAFSLSYSSLMALLILAVFVCNGSVIVSLCQMHRNQLMRRGSVGSTGRRRKLSLAWFGQGEEEMDHLVLLALITVIFVVCSLPLTIAGFVNAIHPFCDTENLTAFRFYALNPIVDPWVFIICRKSVFRHLCSLLSCRFSRSAVKTTARSALSLPLENHIQRNPPDVTIPQTNMYSSLAV